jgi:hypothetical protein
MCNPSHIGGVMISVLASNTIDHELVSRSGQAKDYNIEICCFSAKRGSLRSNIVKIGCLRSEKCVGVERHVYPWTVASLHYKIQINVLV